MAFWVRLYSQLLGPGVDYMQLRLCSLHIRRGQQCCVRRSVSHISSLRTSWITDAWESSAIVGAIGSAGILGTIILIIIALTMGSDVAAINDSAIGQPLAYIYLQAFGAKGSLAIWSFMCLAQVSMTASLVLPSSRQAWAFARDGALPFSKFFSHVDPKTQTPVRTVWLVVGCAVPLGLLGFADPVNESAIK